MANRYIRQETFRGIGKKGQEKLREASVTIIGLGALGSMAANNLARAGVGFIRLVDRDIVEESNLQRQMLYSEDDVRKQLPKAVAALKHLKEINSENTYESVVTDANSSTIDGLIEDADLIIDGTDKFEVRFLMSEACLHHKKNWIYGGARGSIGMTKNFIYGETQPCLRCMMSYDGAKNMPTCATEGILNATTAILASLESNEAIKILTGSDKVREEMLYFDIWENRSRKIAVLKNKECPVCGYGQYSFYGKTTGIQAAALCGRDSVQVVPAEELTVSFSEFAEKLQPFGAVKVNTFTLDFDDGTYGIKLFKNGRAIIKHVMDENRAKSIYTKYVTNQIPNHEGQTNSDQKEHL